METSGLAAPKRRFAGRGEGAMVQDNGFAALADVLLSSPPPSAPSDAPPADPIAPPDPSPVPPEAPPVLEPPAPTGLYVLIPAGIDPADRRRTALAAARHLALGSRPAAIFVFENGRVDAHVVGELACGRLGPQGYLGAADRDRVMTDLLDQCGQVGIVILDPLNGHLRRLGPAARRTVFLTRPDAESVVETYRELKRWRRTAAASEPAILVVGGPTAQEAERLHRRLSRAAREFLGFDLAIQGVLAASASAGPTAERPDPLRVLSETPAAEVWPRLLAAAREAPASPPAATSAEADAAARPPAAPSIAESAARDRASPMAAAEPSDVTRAPAPSALPVRPAAPPPAPAVCPAFALWQPSDKAELTAAIEAQEPSLLAGSLRWVLRVDVDEPDAPPLAAVREDGALVAILLPDPGQSVDTRAAERWLAVHARLLARAYPSAGVAADATPSAIVLAAYVPPPPTDGIRRFVPIKLGGHRGIVLLP